LAPFLLIGGQIEGRAEDFVGWADEFLMGFMQIWE
jgi:hypothetical protein